MSYLPGIDVSKWQGLINWKEVFESQYYTFIKASEGKTEDGWFRKNWEETKKVGMPRGAYHYFRPASSWQIQAEFFAQTIGGMNYDGELPPALDVEVTEGLDKTAMNGVLFKFCKRFKELTGLDVVIYTRMSVWDTGVEPNDWAKQLLLWVANYGVTSPLLPFSWKKTGRTWCWWQWTGKGSCPGVTGAVDQNWYNGDLAKFNKQFGTNLLPKGEEEVRHLLVTATALKIRIAPTTVVATDGLLVKGDQPENLEEFVDSNGNTWARIGWHQWAAKIYYGAQFMTDV
jgi:lysozyme